MELQRQVEEDERFAVAWKGIALCHDCDYAAGAIDLDAFHSSRPSERKLAQS